MGHMALHRAGEKQGPSPESLLEGRTRAPHRPPRVDAQQLLRPLVDLGSNSRKLPQSTPWLRLCGAEACQRRALEEVHQFCSGPRTSAIIPRNTRQQNSLFWFSLRDFPSPLPKDKAHPSLSLVPPCVPSGFGRCLTVRAYGL